MLERIKSIFAKKEEKEDLPLIVCIHGFGRRRSTEYNNFKLWGEGSYEFITFDIFDVYNLEDVDPLDWLRRCERKVEEAKSTGRDVHVIGFSMGGVIASYLASKYEVNKLMLIAPAFEYMSASTIYQAIQKKLTSSSDDGFTMSDNQVKAFSTIVSMCKDSIQNVQCPVLLIHGDRDEVIPLRSSLNAYDKVPHQNKRLIILHEAPHRVMLFDKSRNEAYQLFDLFMQDKLITYEPEIAIDPIGELESLEGKIDEILKEDQTQN